MGENPVIRIDDRANSFLKSGRVIVLYFIFFGKAFENVPKIYLYFNPPCQYSCYGSDFTWQRFHVSFGYVFYCFRTMPLIRHDTVWQLMMDASAIATIKTPYDQCYLFPIAFYHHPFPATAHQQCLTTNRTITCFVRFYKKKPSCSSRR